jgi:hypothetical protein
MESQPLLDTPSTMSGRHHEAGIRDQLRIISQVFLAPATHLRGSQAAGDSKCNHAPSPTAATKYPCRLFANYRRAARPLPAYSHTSTNKYGKLSQLVSMQNAFSAYTLLPLT